MPVVSVNNKPKYPVLMLTNTPLRIEKLHHCVFNPVVYLDRGKLYFIKVYFRFPYIPEPGFYDVPEKSYITWIRDFKPVAVSQRRSYPEWDEDLQKTVTRHAWAYIFEAMEGDAPKESGLIV